MLVWKTDFLHVDRLYDAMHASVVFQKCLLIFQAGKTYSRINPSNSSDESLFISAFFAFFANSLFGSLGRIGGSSGPARHKVSSQKAARSHASKLS